jgi:predicted secreted hydrolase
MNYQRRHALLTGAQVAAAFTLFGPRAVLALPLKALQFPRDFGSHPDLRTEWWYITGQAQSGSSNSGGSAPREFGFQITFFRSRVDGTQSMQSAFAAKQLVFAHAAVTDLDGKKLWHDQRIARAGMGVASANETGTDLRLRDWTLLRDATGYHAQIPASEFTLDLHFKPTQPVLLQGNAGLSRKGPEPAQASYYYSEPQLGTTGQLRLNGRNFDLTGTAWLDHEWSEALLHPDAVGWDWMGMNLNDGSALTAFRLRDKAGGTLWSGGSFRSGSRTNEAPRAFTHDEVTFEPLRRWKSPASQATYPVEWSVQTPVGRFKVSALLDDQELDSRNSTGAIYWEGLSELRDERGDIVGRGYLEMTGYAQALKL